MRSMLIILGTCFPRLNRIGLCTCVEYLLSWQTLENWLNECRIQAQGKFLRNVCVISKTQCGHRFFVNFRCFTNRILYGYLTKLKQYKNYDATLEWISFHCDVHCVPNKKRCILCVLIITYCYLEPSQNKKGQKIF